MRGAARAPTAAARHDETLKNLLELNRNGSWEEAARLGMGFLTLGPYKPVGQRCEAMQGLAYAQNRLGRTDYSNEGVQLLSPVIDRAAGEPAQD